MVDLHPANEAIRELAERVFGALRSLRFCIRYRRAKGKNNFFSKKLGGLKKGCTFAAALGNRANENRETSSLIYCKDSVPPSWKRGGGTEKEIEITGREKCLYGLIEVI
ncbi:hypothetical protein [Arenibacter algicola]|uniref:hypothetical protein n=1 Tax=Arenibacter algicola TaxID=616991 RepID=UPI00114E63CF